MNKLKISITIFLLLGFFGTVHGASFEFKNTGNLPIGECKKRVDIEIDVGTTESNASDLEIIYNPGEITILDSDPNQDGVQIRTGNAYQSYFYNQVFQNTGRIKIATLSFSNFLSGRRLYASIEFTSQPNITSTNFTILFNGIGNTLDSNIADRFTNFDILTSVQNGSYTFVDTPCDSEVVNNDTIKPIIDFIYPKNNEVLVPKSPKVLFAVRDMESGIDISSLEIQFLGKIYSNISPEVELVSISKGFLIIFSPGELFYGQKYNLNVDIKDLFGNNANDSIEFTTEIEKECLEVCTNITNIDNVKINNPLTESIIKNLLIGESQQSFSNISLFSLLAGILPFLLLSNIPLALLNLILLALKRKKSSAWGLILDFATKQPLAFVTIRAYNAQTTYFITQTITDLEGRYGFLLGDGKYRLEIQKDGYEKFIKDIEIRNGENNIDQEIFLKKLGLYSVGYKNSKLADRIKHFIKKIYSKILAIILVIGFIMSIIALIFNLSLLNIALFLVYLLMFYGLLRINNKNGIKAGSIIDSSTSYRIPFATIKVYDKNSLKLVDIKKTNLSGYFDFYLKPAQYLIEVLALGYTFPSSTSKNDERINNMLKVYLKRGGNRLNIYVDPIDNQQKTEDNLPNPFSK